MSTQTPQEVAQSLPPLTDAQVARIAQLLSFAKPGVKK